ncbi:MAG: hypothetical protein A3A80_03550 [Candidatus Terrybacteria bacterium RIFCSPLOWO2_01_FULL_44_24]|uniref:SnoaL-like domain-containing protein n=1 Tax=Candidatus Terrybacteria bacterium RIFCSPHIGHO2_01_FULL_43_35 TaxID=1802361 RepID=A0A1G2PDM5_9BACT|nr:MAG: hypothetical protein A2828_00470 [Candidatus Terrybacteria bacterium RIFCSPHIGHO2_01_FULL_43_35]OHA49758.1 MAG: hypothetical protein A3B75_02045 [Candidatus Terrybacteria bacterium RIFCSPHIGHO2_02_FULL_43_14]OHA51580.1 MAG: hypothetical protein A3A80_03550 [Candidatus Terrybacteria bacterium RIFCSPLOWO2_01_FULL_44_24]
MVHKKTIYRFISFFVVLALFVAAILWLRSENIRKQKEFEALILGSKPNVNQEQAVKIHALALKYEDASTLLFDYADQPLLTIEGMSNSFDGNYESLASIKSTWQNIFTRGDFKKVTLGDVKKNDSGVVIVNLENFDMVIGGSRVDNLMLATDVDVNGKIKKDILTASLKPLPQPPSEAIGGDTSCAPQGICINGELCPRGMVCSGLPNYKCYPVGCPYPI